MLQDYLKRILTAPVYEVAVETPLTHLPQMSARFDADVWLKREDLQPVFSYKLRGAYTLMASLSEAQLEAGVIAASAGNHAQGVALAAQRLGTRATIVMPKTTPEIKVRAVRRLGGEVMLHGNSYDEASEQAHEIEQREGLTYIPPFDHPLTIAGQGTVGMEILRQFRGPLDAIFIPVGGGGLIAGIGAFVKAVSPEVRIIGVEPAEAPSLQKALEADAVVTLDNVGIFADGAAVKQVGPECFRVAREVVDDLLLVSTDEICAAIKDTFEDTRALPEPAGALALAGMKQYARAHGIAGQHVVAVCSGANVNFDRLRYIAELAEIGEGREALFAVTIPERPGSFRAFCHALGPRGITEFNYRYADDSTAQVFTGVQLKHGAEEKATILENLKEKGYDAVDISDDEMAKSHVRYMVGGHGVGVENEVVYRFEFPERPGALLQFLTRIGESRNISMFHYRNHGAAYGRALVGIQVPPGAREDFDAFLDELGIDHRNETDSPAYRLFLR